MTVFFYDKTFEGLLTAIFDTYKRKTVPDSLLENGAILPMFCTETHEVISDEEKSGRVWKSLEKKLSKYSLNMLMLVWLSEEPGSDMLLFRYICKCIDSKENQETSFADSDTLEAHNIAKKVAHEQLYIKQFVRFQKTADGIFFAPIAPRHNALPLTIDHFKDRYSDQKWIIYDTVRNYGYFYDLHKVEEITINADSASFANIAPELLAENEGLYQEMWSEYFKALTIKERLNLRLQKQHMPKRFWNNITEMKRRK